MNKVILCLLIFFAASCTCYAEDVSTDDLWNNFGTTQDFYGQDKPAVSDEDFDKALESLKKKQNKFGNWLKKRQIPKGEEFHQGNETEVINEDVGDKNSLPVICIPTELVIGDGILPIGHYQVSGDKDDEGNVSLKFYQAQYLMAQIPAIETDDDFGEDTISFVKWSNEGETSIKIMFGSLDFNAYTTVNIKE